MARCCRAGKAVAMVSMSLVEMVGVSRVRTCSYDKGHNGGAMRNEDYRLDTGLSCVQSESPSQV